MKLTCILNQGAGDVVCEAKSDITVYIRMLYSINMLTITAVFANIHP